MNPDLVTYAQVNGDNMKLVSWNVNGLRACIKKDFYASVEAMDPDILCLQETKLQEGQVTLELPEEYHCYWNYAVKKGYSGTALFSRKEPLNVTLGLGIEEHDQEGRVITAEFDDNYVITLYTPNSQDGLKRLDYRMEWEDAFRNYIVELDKIKPVIFCGDLNVAHQEIDLKNPKTNHNNPGFTDQEREKFSVLLDKGFIDSFRYLYPEKEAYSWWSYRFHAREKNIGWRIDYFVLSQRLKEKVKDAIIYQDIFGSDHCPVGLILE